MAYEAGRVVVELEAQNGSFDATIRSSAQTYDGAMAAIERSSAQAERTVSRSATSIVASHGQVSAATRNLGFQISDVGQQLSGGQSPLVIFGQQAPQFVQAFQDISAAGAGLGTVLRSIALPGLLAVVSVLGTLIERTLGAAQAEGAHKAAADALSEAVDRLAGASARSNHQTQIGISLDIQAAEAKRQRTIRTREQLQADLQAAQARLKVADNQSTVGDDGGINFGVAAGATQEREIRRINGLLADNAKEIQKSQTAIASGRAQIVLRDIAASTDRAAGANQRYENTIDRLRRKFERGGFGDVNSSAAQAEFRRLGEAAVRQRDAVLEAGKASERASTSARGHSVSLRLQNTAAREAAAAQRELETALTGLIRKYDPATAAAADYAAELKKIAELEKAGRVTAEQAGQFREGAAVAYRKSRADAFNLDTVENYRPEAAEADKQAKDAARAQEQAVADAEQALQQRREGNIRSLANIYEDVFTTSTARAWDNFKRDGLRALAIVLARATVASFSSGGGGFGSLLGNITKLASTALKGGGSTPGFASGGSLLIGGNSGTDRNLLSLNGAPVAAVSKGEVLNISPNIRTPSRGGGVTVIAPQSFDLRGVLMTEKVLQQMDERNRQYADAVGAAATKQAIKGAPAYQRRQAPLVG